MSNPYDPYPGSGDQTPPPPYGEPIQSGGGGGYPPSPYGSAPGGYGAPAPRTDGLSITAFVLSLTCVLSVVGLILGFIGLGRTKNNQRKGRWAAVAAIPIGIIGTLALVGGIILVVFVVKNSITPENAEVGQCADVSEDNNQVSLLKKDCTESHEVEIVAVSTVSEVDGFADLSPYDICPPLLSDDYNEALSNTDEPFELGVVTADPDNPGSSDKFICYVERSIGSFTSPLRG